ncbi:hypothetical protein TEA_016732 [Camellia sinensis var. sinensis]|uniref:Uncharacterized protein n=1 Tax=Camellia sinensis var. sinensis TaxID=542762 RepID=A0A4S4DIC0_CAMSN|nr:hypothetical protein TEA_016732 [Camellia sinensis var. sinensis]
MSSGETESKRSQTSFESAAKTKRGEVERKKGTPWTKEEHRERLLADPKFLHRLAIEEAISITITLLAQYERRKENFFEELDYVITDTVRGSVVDFFTVWLPAPTLSFLSIGDTIDTPDSMEALKGLLGSILDNAFQKNIAGNDWNVNHRVASVLFGGLKLAGVGFISSIGTVVVALNFGDFYDMQYVKMYNIFMLFGGPMSKLRLLMICRMAKPEEVLIIEDENGNIVRETMKDNDVLVQYKVLNLYLAGMESNLSMEAL